MWRTLDAYSNKPRFKVPDQIVAGTSIIMVRDEVRLSTKEDPPVDVMNALSEGQALTDEEILMLDKLPDWKEKAKRLMGVHQAQPSQDTEMVSSD